MTSNLISMFSILIAFTAVTWSMRSHFHKLKQENFRIYADKYNAIIKPEVYAEWRACLNGDKSLYEKHRSTMIAFLNLAWEEIYLAQHDLISKDLWQIWRPLISSVVQNEFAKQIIFEFDYDDIIREFDIQKL